MIFYSINNYAMWIFKFITDFFKRITEHDSESSTVTNNEPTGNTTGVNMIKRGLFVGINDYPGTNNDLNGCVNDFKDWTKELATSFGVSSYATLVNEQATKESIKKNLTKMINKSVPGDLVVFTYSGHGSFVVDTSKDEPDSKDETLYTYNGNLVDDELRAIISKAQDGVKIVIILDSCHSGTGTRMYKPNSPKPRFMPPTDPEVIRLGSILPFAKATTDEENMKEILFSGCKSTEYSYDANYNGVPNGAFTKVAIEALKKLKDPTYQEWYDEIRRNLPSRDYPQTPQFEGSRANKNRKVFS